MIKTIDEKRNVNLIQEVGEFLLEFGYIRDFKAVINPYTHICGYEIEYAYDVYTVVVEYNTKGYTVKQIKHIKEVG